MRHIFLNRRGIEEVPLKLIVGILFLALLIGITFHQISVFIEFGGRKNFAENMLGVIEAMESLQSASGYGGFSRVKVTVPPGYTAEFFHVTNTIKLTTPDGVVELTPPGKLSNTLVLAPGKYELLVYYGPQEAGQIKPLEICFT